MTAPDMNAALRAAAGYSTAEDTEPEGTPPVSGAGDASRAGTPPPSDRHADMNAALRKAVRGG